MPRDRAVIVGAGIAGLVSAFALAARGLDVTVLERAAAPGGKMRQLASKRKAIEAHIAALQAEAEAETEEVHFAISQETQQEKTTHQNTDAMAQQRGGATNSIAGTKELTNGIAAAKEIR